MRKVRASIESPLTPIPGRVTFQHEQERERTDRYTGERFKPVTRGMQPKVPGWQDVNIAELARAMRRPYGMLCKMLAGKQKFVRWDDLRMMAQFLEMPMATVIERVEYSQRLGRLDTYRLNIREDLMKEMIEQARFGDWEAIKKLITPEAAALVIEDIREGRITE